MPEAKKTKPKAKPKAKTETVSKSIAQVKGFIISAKRSGRFLVRTTKGKTVNGPDKTKVLLEAKLIQAGTPKAKEAASAEGTSA